MSALSCISLKHFWMTLPKANDGTSCFCGGVGCGPDPLGVWKAIDGWGSDGFDEVAGLMVGGDLARSLVFLETGNFI